MFAGYIILLFSIIILLPWGHDFPPVEIPSKYLTQSESLIFFKLSYSNKQLNLDSKTRQQILQS
jgi:hypothetical protein